MPHSPPLPVSARYLSATGFLEVTFDRLLQPGALDPSNWRIRETDQRRLGAAPCSAAGKVVTCRMGGGVLEPGPDEVDYQPPPFDVLSTFGVPAALFLGFPLTVV